LLIKDELSFVIVLFTMKQTISSLLTTLAPKRLKSRLILLIGFLIFFLVGVGGSLALRLIAGLVEEHIGERALQVSMAVARIPQIREDLAAGDLEQSRIQEIAESIREATGAEFVVVGDRHGRRFSHPVAERLGQAMVGGDNMPALIEGKSYVSRAVGTLGPSIRGKSPVLDSNGEVIGVVSVGYLVDDIRTLIWGYYAKIGAFLILVSGIGVLFALRIAESFKKAIFGLEPEEIAALLQERTTTLETIREGVLAVDAEGRITTINQAAIRMLRIDTEEQIIGRLVTKVIPQSRIPEVLATGESQLDQLMLVDDKEIVVNRIPIKSGNRVTGAVSSFRDRDELDRLARKLSQVEKYTEMLRAQTHEYSNKLHTIVGLIQTGAVSEAVELIGSETSGYQAILSSLMQVVKDPLIAATILGKYNRARELKINFTIDPGSSMRDVPVSFSRDRLVTILGNILDNAFEAVLAGEESTRQVRLSMTDLGRDLIFECDDSGAGIAKELRETIFSRGFTTKTERGHGVGLFLVEKALRRLKGTVSIGDSDLGGACFTVMIPKNQESDDAIDEHADC
jgi:sensor histidine kinase regulating citrate/malate metabolism